MIVCISKSFNAKIIASLVFFAILSMKSLVLGQSLIQINARFAKPEFIPEKELFFLDVELNSPKTRAYLSGMNVRFFYDATKLEFLYWDQFSDGYGPMGDPEEFQSNGSSGFQLFNIPGTTTFLNGAIQLVDEQSPLLISPNQWVKVFRVGFRLPSSFVAEKEFCPSVFWDLEPSTGGGGFLMGDDGLTITIMEHDPNTPEVSAPTRVSASSFNWQQSYSGGVAYGEPTYKNCVYAEKLGKREDEDGKNLKTYSLFQNEPNPFNHGTSIEFTLPSSQEVVLKFYDISGKAIDEIKGEYSAGKNVVNLDHQPWLEGAKVIFYRMETEGYRSKMFKMVVQND